MTNEEPVRPELTPEQEKEFQDAKDDSIIFVLAALMVDSYIASVSRNQEALQSTYMRASQLILADPTFVKRFKERQQALLKEAGMEVTPQPPKSRIITP